MVERFRRKHYINTGTEESPVWSPAGEGFTEFTESKNTVSYGRRYINESIRRCDVTGYSPQIDYAFEVYTDNAAISLIREITDMEKCGAEAQIEILTVDEFEDTGTPGVYNAVRRKYSVIPDRCGPGNDVLYYTGAMKAAGALSRGIFVSSTGIFNLRKL